MLGPALRRGPRLGRYGNGTEETVDRGASFHTRQSVASRAMSMGPQGVQIRKQVCEMLRHPVCA
jgi:hypothetical protein